MSHAWQRYSDPAAVERMHANCCPECGHQADEHDGAGGPHGCTLTDTGVAGRIRQYVEDRREEARARGFAEDLNWATDVERMRVE